MATVGTTTGLDVNALVTGLMKIERAPVDKLTAKETSYQAKLTALGQIKSKMATLQSAATNLGSSSTSSLAKFTATASDSSVFSATAASTAVAGTYSLAVTNLAQAQKLVTTGQASSTTALSDGTATTVSFDFGTISGGTLSAGAYSGATFTANGNAPLSITIDSSNNTLEGIRDAINAAGAGVTATLINDGSATSPYRLALSVNNSGISNSLKITTSGGDGTINTLLAQDPAGLPAAQHLNQTVAAQNANFSVNGIAISKASNSISDAIQGVSLTLTNTTTNATLTVARDTSAVSTAVTTLVNAYNDLYSSLKSYSAYTPSSALSTSPLQGESTLRSLQLEMRNIASTAVSSGALTNLNDVGISFKADGTMQQDAAKLNTALSSNFDAVSSLFSSSTGFATRFNSWATQSLSYNGSITNRTDNINKTITQIGDQRLILEKRLTTLEKFYRNQYSTLNVMLVKMQDTSAYLTRQLG